MGLLLSENLTTGLSVPVKQKTKVSRLFVVDIISFSPVWKVKRLVNCLHSRRTFAKRMKEVFRILPVLMELYE